MNKVANTFCPAAKSNMLNPIDESAERMAVVFGRIVSDIGKRPPAAKGMTVNASDTVPSSATSKVASAPVK